MNWKIFLEKCSKAVYKGDDLLTEYEGSPQDWLGYEPASVQEIETMETRLNIKFPPSYKNFLLASNGFKQLSCFIWDILPVDQVSWLAAFDPEFTNLYETEFKDDFIVSDEDYYDYSEKQHCSNFRSEYLINALAISNWGDAAIVLLNPLVKFGDEWEAWIYANWYPGARRFKSFEELMLHEHESYLQLISNR